ncbi:MAG: hypothetical protein ABEJ67_06390 [Halanaeroarchaeum sp.]
MSSVGSGTRGVSTVVGNTLLVLIALVIVAIVALTATDLVAGRMDTTQAAYDRFLQMLDDVGDAFGSLVAAWQA